MSEFKEYPKQLYRKGWGDLSDSVVFEYDDEEDAARAEGFKMLSEEGEEAPKRGRKAKVTE